MLTLSGNQNQTGGLQHWLQHVVAQDLNRKGSQVFFGVNFLQSQTCPSRGFGLPFVQGFDVHAAQYGFFV